MSAVVIVTSAFGAVAGGALTFVGKGMHDLYTLNQTKPAKFYGTVAIGAAIGSAVLGTAGWAANGGLQETYEAAKVNDAGATCSTGLAPGGTATLTKKTDGSVVCSYKAP
jgi:hypothetical protein